MHPAQTRTSAGFRILIDSKASASLRALRVLSKRFVFIGLRTLWRSCRSFATSCPLFSSACGLFCQNRGGWGTPLQEAAARNLPAGPDSILQDGGAVLVDRHL